MTKINAISLCLSLLLLSACEKQDTPSTLNNESVSTYNINVVALSYLLTGPRVMRLESIAYESTFEQKSIVTDLQKQGYVSVTKHETDAGLFTFIERTPLGDKVHDEFSRFDSRGTAP